MKWGQFIAFKGMVPFNVGQTVQEKHLLAKDHRFGVRKIQQDRFTYPEGRMDNSSGASITLCTRIKDRART